MSAPRRVCASRKRGEPHVLELPCGRVLGPWEGARAAVRWSLACSSREFPQVAAGTVRPQSADDRPQDPDAWARELG